LLLFAADTSMDRLDERLIDDDLAHLENTAGVQAHLAWSCMVACLSAIAAIYKACQTDWAATFGCVTEVESCRRASVRKGDGKKVIAHGRGHSGHGVTSAGGTTIIE